MDSEQLNEPHMSDRGDGGVLVRLERRHPCIRPAGHALPVRRRSGPKSARMSAHRSGSWVRWRCIRAWSDAGGGMMRRG